MEAERVSNNVSVGDICSEGKWVSRVTSDDRFEDLKYNKVTLKFKHD